MLWEPVSGRKEHYEVSRNDQETYDYKPRRLFHIKDFFNIKLPVNPIVHNTIVNTTWTVVGFRMGVMFHESLQVLEHIFFNGASL